MQRVVALQRGSRTALILSAALLLNATLLACSGEITSRPNSSAGDGDGDHASPGDGDGDGSGDGDGDGDGPQAGAAGGDGDGVQGTTPDPGRVTLHRLNRAEYNNTVRDLLGTTLRPADDFPPDDRGYGYDNIADVLSLSPVLLEMYWNAAEALVGDALSVVAVGARRYEAEAMTATTGAAYQGTAWNLYSSGSVQQTITIETEGRYRISVRAWAQQAGADPAQMSIDVNAVPVSTLDVLAESSTPETYQVETDLEAGSVILGASFLNDFYDEATGADRNLFVDFVELEGPLGVDADNPLRARVLSCEPAADEPETCLRTVVSAFGRRAFRRPLAQGEVDALVAIASDSIAAGDTVEEATRLMLRAVLVSPHFLFRVEQDPDPAALTPHFLSPHELASRLSYFLWSSMPDDTLLDLADSGELSEPSVLSAQVERMLDHEKAEALLHNFAGQWLFIRAIDDHEPDYEAYPEFDDELRGAMRNETERFVRELMFGDGSMSELLTADYTYVNQRLASHYGLDPVSGSELTRVSLAGTDRKGLLTQGSILMVTSYATRTSPVKRGKWVLEQLLCSSPPPPPPGVEGLMPEETATGSLRERMEAHRSDPVCASCHTAMDPIGFSFEHYDGIGKYRDTDQGFDIDAKGVLPDGTSFDGPLQLAGLLSQDERLPQCIAEQLFTYALGRGAEPFDDDDIEAVTSAFVASGQSFRTLVTQIVLSEAFRMRRGEEPLP